MGKKMWWPQAPVDLTTGLWLNAERDEFDTIHYSMTILGRSIPITSAEYYEMHDQFADALRDGQRSGRMRVLEMLEKNLDRFDYSNNACNPLSLEDFAKMCEQ